LHEPDIYACSDAIEAFTGHVLVMCGPGLGLVGPESARALRVTIRFKGERRHRLVQMDK
jgi:hypothetical protein